MTELFSSLQRLNRCGLSALVAFAGFTLISCSGDSNESAPRSDINSRDPATLQDGGGLRLPLSVLPRIFNPLHIDPVEYTDVAKAMYPRAFVVGPDGSATLNTDYFSGAALTGTHPQVVTYTINPKAVWTDGSPLSWEDIASQVHALSGADPAFAGQGTTGFDQVALVSRGSDDRQAVITFKHDYSEWRGMFAGDTVLLPRSMTATPDAFNKVQLDGPGPSAGPFMFSHLGWGEMTLIRNPKWWGRVPRLDSITYVLVYPGEQLQALQDDRIDVARLTSANDLATAKSTDGIAIRRAPERLWTVLTYNGAPGAILQDSALRQAISKGIDREAIINVTQRGLVDTPLPLNNHIYVAGQQGYHDNVSECCSYNPELARKELDARGWKLHGDTREKDGRKLVIYDVIWDTKADRDLGRLVQNYLSKIGVKLTIVNPTENPPNPVAKRGIDPTWQPPLNFVMAGDFDVTSWEVAAEGFPLKGMNQLYGTSGPYNVGKITSKPIDDKIAEVLAQMDDNTSRDLANAVDRMLWQEGHSLPLGQSPGVVAVRNDLANYGAFGMADINYVSIGFTR
jgi:peptide/nickel transport system substrate-binding protein